MDDDIELIDAAGVQRIVPFSPSAISKMELAQQFPASVAIGLRKRAWVKSEVVAWVARRVAERDDPAAVVAARRRRDPNAWTRRSRNTHSNK